jgi:TP901 family phage tail tape measure protein
MAGAFNLTAQLNLKGPSNIGNIVANIKNQLGNINATIKFTLDPNAAKNVSQLDANLKSLNQTLKDTNVSATSAANALKQFSSAVNQNSVAKLQSSLNSANQASQKFSQSQSDISNVLKTSSSEMEEFGKQAGLAVRRFAAFSAVTSVIYGVVNSVNKGVGAFVDFDKEFVKLQQVTGESASGLKSLEDTITSLSTGLGASSSELVNVASTLAQAGLNALDTEKALKALALSSLAPSFDNMNETVEGSIALMRQFGISAGDLDKALGSVNAVAAKFAVEASDIISAVQRTGGVFAAASRGVSEGTDALNEFVAVFTSVRATTRESAETIATGLRTIFTRVQRESTIEALKEYGVNLTDLDGKFVGAYKSVELLSKGLSNLDPRDLKFSRIVEELGGFRQIGKVIPLIQEFGTAQQALGVAQQGSGSLAADAAKAQLSLANQLAKTREEFLAFFREIGKSDTFQTIVRGSLQLTSALIKVADSAKGLLPLLGTIFAIQGVKALTKFTTGVVSGARKGPDQKADNFAYGGVVPGSGNSDSVPAMLTPGEFVMRKAAVKAIGANKLHTMNRYASGGSVRRMSNGGRLYDEIEPQFYAASNKGGNAGKIKVHDGDGLKVLVDPTKELVDKKFTKPDGQTLIYPKDKVGSSLVPVTSRLRGVDAFESLLSKKERKAYGNKTGGPAAEQNRIRGEEAKVLTLNYINKNFEKDDLSKILKKTNEVDYFGRPILDMPELASKIISKNLGKKFDTSSLIGADALANRKVILSKRFPQVKESELERLIIKDYQANYQLDETKSAIETETGLKQSKRIIDTKSDARFIEAYAGSDAPPYKLLKKVIEDDYQSAQQYATGGRVQKFASGSRVEKPQKEVLSSSPTPMLQSVLSRIEKNPISREYQLSEYKKNITDRLNQAYKGIIMPGTKPSKEDVTKNTVISMYDDYVTRGYVEATVGALEKDLTFVKGGVGTDKEALKKRKGVDVGDMLDSIRAYQAIGLDYVLNTALTEGRTSETLAQFMGDSLPKSFETTGRGNIQIASLVKNLEAAAQHKMPETLYSGVGSSKLKTILDQAALKPKDGIDKLVGKSFTMPSFISTSDNESIADSFARVGKMTISTNPKRRGIIPEDAKTQTLDRESVSSRKKKTRLINSEYGDKGFGGSYVNESYTDNYDSEGEYIFPPNSKFKILSAQGRLPSGEDVGNVDMKVQQLRLGGMAQRLADGGVAQRKVGYIDSDVLSDKANADRVRPEMEKLSIRDVSEYKTYLSKLAASARKSEDISKLRTIVGLPGAGKSALMLGNARADNASLRKTERFPILAPSDINKATEIIDTTATVTPDRIEDYLQYADKIALLSTSTRPEREELRRRRQYRAETGINLFGRSPQQGLVSGAETDSGPMEAYLASEIDPSKIMTLGIRPDFKLSRKKGTDLPLVEKRKIAVANGAFSPTTKGHQQLQETATALGFTEQDFLALIGSDEALKSTDPHSFRTAVFDQDFRALMARAAFKNASISKKSRGFGIPSVFEVDSLESGQRRFLRPLEGSIALTGDDKDEKDLSKYIAAGLKPVQTPRTEGVSGTEARAAIMAQDTDKMRKLLSPEVFDIVQQNSSRLQNRANIIPRLIENSQQRSSSRLQDLEAQISKFPSRIDRKRAAIDPEYAAVADQLDDLRQERDKIKNRSNIEPFTILRKLAQRYPQTYGLDLSPNGSSTELSPLLESMYQSIQRPGSTLAPADSEPEWAKYFTPPDQLNFNVPASKIIAFFRTGRFPSDPTLGEFSGKPIAGQDVNKVWRKSYSSTMSAEKASSYTAAKNYLAKNFGEDVKEQRDLQIKNIQKSTKVGVVGLQPADKKEIQGPMDLGGENTSLFISGLSSEYSKAVENWRSRQVENDVKFATDIQHQKMFGSADRYAFDFDETLVKGADILDANGKPDIPRYGDINAVRESMKNAELTQLGKKVKELMKEDPSFIKKSRILTARPQMTAGILAETLQRLELPFQESDITGVSRPVGQGGLNIIDEATKRINNSTIAKAKAQDVRELESLIDDNLENVIATKKAGKQAFHYTEISENLSEEQLQAHGIANIEGASLEMVLARLGARGGTIQNRAIDYENGLGPAAQYFPGIGYDWPTEVKRTVDSDAISKAKEEFTRYYSEKNKVSESTPQMVQAMAAGGKASRKVDFEAGVGASPFGNAVSGKLGSSVYDLEKSSGLSSYEFEDAKRFADSAGYNMSEFKEYLSKRAEAKRSRSGQKTDVSSLLKTLSVGATSSTPKQLALAEQLKGEPDAGYRPILTEAQRIAANRSSIRNSALEDINNATRFAVGGVAEKKQEKPYGKISITEDSGMISAGYLKNNTRSGYATAYKMRDYLYYVGLSSATSGYGPRLYDVLMEAATEKGAMLTSDRSTVSGDAKAVWKYYFNNRDDVKKTPLKPSDWTRNEAMLDPKLHGREETWPPANDPAWILQSGYSKSPSIINGPDVIKSSNKLDSRALMDSFFASRMETGGKVDPNMEKYKGILSSILPPEFLSKEGLLRTPDGGSEEIEILSPKQRSFLSMITGSSPEEAPPASYEGALPHKILRHNLEKQKGKIDPKEYERLQKYISGALAWHGGHDVIDVRKSSHRGVLAHESFHDIQGFLYDNYPEIIDKLFASIEDSRPEIEDWYNTKASKDYKGPRNYDLSHFFPTKDTKVINQSFGYEAFGALINKKKKSKTQEIEIPSRVGSETVSNSLADIGRNETLPVLLSAASEGDSRAAEILSNIFGSTGLKKDFYKTLPRFAGGGIVPGVGNSDTVPATLSVGDFVIKKNSVNSIGSDKLFSMAGYAGGGSVDQVPALLTPGEFVFPKASAEKIGYGKLHRMNKVGKFASGGMVGGRMPFEEGGLVGFLQDLTKLMNNSGPSKLPVRPDQITSSSVGIDKSTTNSLTQLSNAIKELGVSSSATANVIKEGGDVSYKSAMRAYEIDLERLKIAGGSAENIITAENNLNDIREKSLKTITQRASLESAFAESNIGKSQGSGAAQQKILVESDKIEKSLLSQKENQIAAALNTGPGGMLGAPLEEIRAMAKQLVSVQEKAQMKDLATLSATQKVTGINKSELSGMGISGSDISQYISRSSLDRKTLDQMDKQLVKDKEQQLKNSQSFGLLTFQEQKQRLDEVRSLAQQEVEKRRQILNEIAQSQGLPSLEKKDVGSKIADAINSRYGSLALGSLPIMTGLLKSSGIGQSNAEGAANMAGINGASSTLVAGVKASASFGPYAPFALAGTAVATFATYVKDSTNAFVEFQKNLTSKNLQLAISNLEQMFNDLSKDISDINIKNNITREIEVALSGAKKSNDLDYNNPKSYFANIFDRSKNSDTTDRSKILERFGTGAYYKSLFDRSVQDSYAQQLIPERAQGYAKQFSDASMYSQKYIESQVNSGSSYEDIKNAPNYQSLAESIALSSNRVQEQIMEIDRSTIANKEAAKAAIIRAYADEQVYKAVKNTERQRLSESADREAKTFAMSFDRLFNNMNQSIDTTNFSLSRFNDQLEASTAALSGQAEIRSTKLGAINTLKNPNMASDSEFRSAADSGASLFGNEKGLISSILNLGKELEPSIMQTINKTIQDNPGGVSDTKISMAIDRTIAGKLGGTGLPKNLAAQLSQQIGDAVEQIRKKEGSGTKDRRIDFSELINAVPALRDTFDALKSASNGVIAALENQQKALDDYNQKINESVKYQIEAANRRNRADDIVVNGSLELARAFGQNVDPTMGIKLRDQRTARLTGGPTSASDIQDSIIGLEARRKNQQASLDALKNRSTGQPSSTQSIMDNERALSKTNYQLNQTYSALKNLAESSDAAASAMSAIQAAQQKQSGKVSLLEKLIGSTPEELFDFNNALVRLQRTAGGQQMGQTADQRKEVMTVLNDILPLIGNNQQANNLKADVFENLLRDSGVGVNPQFAEIINSMRNPEADPAIKLAADEFKKATQQQAEYNRSLANLSQNIAKDIVVSSAELLTKALNETAVKFDKQQIQDIVNGIRNASTVMKPADPQMKAAGGVIYAAGGDYVNFQSRGTDTVPAMLTPGEFVMKKSAVDSIGVSNLSRMNNGYQNGGQVRYYADGGYVTDSLKPEYKENVGGILQVKKSGKFSTTGEYPQIDVSLEDLKSQATSFGTLQNLQKIQNFAGISSNDLSLESTPSEIKYNLGSAFGFGFPTAGVAQSKLVSRYGGGNGGLFPEHTVTSSFSRAPSLSLLEVGKFLAGSSSQIESLKTLKKLEFNGPEAVAETKLAEYIRTIRELRFQDLVPESMKIDSNTYKIKTGSGSYDILSPNANKVTTSNPITLRAEKVGNKYPPINKIGFSNLAENVGKNIGLYSSNDSGTGISSGILDPSKLSNFGLSSRTETLPDFLVTRNYVRPQPYSGNSVTNENFLGSYVKSIGDRNTGHLEEKVSQAERLNQLQRISEIVNSTWDNIGGEVGKLQSTDSDLEMEKSLAVLRDLYQGTVVSAPINDKYFDLNALGSSKNSIQVFSTSTDDWNNKYLNRIQEIVKGDVKYKDLSYYGKSPKSFDISPEAGGDIRRLPWADAGLPIDKEVGEALQREVDNKLSSMMPNVVQTPKSGSLKIPKNAILSQDLSLPYQLDFSKYVSKFWNPITDTLSDEDILGGNPAYLANSSAALENPLQSLLTNNKRLFATDAGLADETLQKQMVGLISSDNDILTYLNTVLTDGHDSEKAQSLEKSSLDKFFRITSAADKVGFLTKASSVRAQRGELFVKTPDMFGDTTEVSFRNYIISAAKKLSDTNKNDQIKGSKQRFDADTETEGFLEPQEYPGAALALILGAQELFGAGSQYELPKILGRNWFSPTLNNRYKDIYEVPNEVIKSYMGGLATDLNDKAGIIDQNGRYFADRDPATYDLMTQAYSYIDGARKAFSAFSAGDTGSISLKDYFPKDIFKTPTPQGDPAANEAAKKMFLSLGMTGGDGGGQSSYVYGALQNTLSKDDQRFFGKQLEGSQIDKGEKSGDIDLQNFDPVAGVGGKWDDIYNLALSPYNQYTNRDIRKLLLDQFISRIPTATKKDGTPLFSATTGRLFDQALRTMRYWYGGEEAIQSPLRNWPGTDYLYDSGVKDPNTGDPLSFSQKLDELINNNDPQLYDNAKSAYEHVGGKQRFGDLPTAESYSKYNPEIIEAEKKQTGGLIYASAGSLIDFSPRGTDTVPAMLTPGEFVVNARATSSHLPLLKAINSGLTASSSDGYQNGGVAYLVDGGQAAGRPFGQPQTNQVKDDQTKSNKIAALGTAPRIAGKYLDPSNGKIRWNMALTNDSYSKYRKDLEVTFFRLATVKEQEEEDSYRRTVSLFAEFRSRLKENVSKLPAGEYGTAKTFLDSLEREYLLSSSGGGIGSTGFNPYRSKKEQNDKFKKKLEEEEALLREELKDDPKELDRQLKFLPERDKNRRIAAMGMPPRLNSDALDPKTGKIKFPIPATREDLKPAREEVQSQFSDLSTKGQGTRLNYSEYSAGLDRIKRLKEELKGHIDEYSAGDYGKAKTQLDSLEREWRISAGGGGVGGQGESDIYKRKPVSSNQSQRIASVGSPGRISSNYLDPKTGNITWPVVLTDETFSEQTAAIQEGMTGLGGAPKRLSYEEYQKQRKQIEDLQQTLKDNVDTYPAADYGKAATFLGALKTELTNTSQGVGIGGTAEDWRTPTTGKSFGSAPGIKPSFLRPDGKIVWPTTLTDSTFDKQRAKVDQAFKNLALHDGEQIPEAEYREGMSVISGLMSEMKDNVDNYNAGEYGSARSFLNSLERAYGKSATGGGIDGVKYGDWKKEQDRRNKFTVDVNPNALQDVYKNIGTNQASTYDSVSAMMSGYDAFSLRNQSVSPEDALDMAMAQTELNRQKTSQTKNTVPATETVPEVPTPTVSPEEKSEAKKPLDPEFQAAKARAKERSNYYRKLDAMKKRTLDEVAKEGAWDVTVFGAEFNSLVNSGVPVDEKWTADQFRKAISDDLTKRDYGRRDWKGVVPSTYYTQSPEYKAQQEKKEKDRQVKGPYAPGLPGTIDKATDQAMTGIVLPIFETVARGASVLRSGSGPETEEMLKRNREALGADARLAEDERRKLIGTDKNAFGANVGDQAQAKFLALPPEEQKEYLDLRSRAQKGMKKEDYTRLDYFQKTLGVPYQQREVIAKAYESDVSDISEPRTKASLSSQMKDMRALKDDMPLLGSRKYVEGLPGAFEEGATLGTVLTKESSEYGDRLAETAQGTGEVVTGSFKAVTGATVGAVALGGSAVSLPGSEGQAMLREFGNSAFETANQGVTQVQLGAARGVGKNILDAATGTDYYAAQQQLQQQQFDAVFQKQKSQSEDLLPGLGTSYDRAENLSQSAYTAATMAALQDVAIGAFTKPKDYSGALKSAGSGQTAGDRAFEDALLGKSKWSDSTKPFPEKLSTPTITVDKGTFSPPTPTAQTTATTPKGFADLTPQQQVDAIYKEIAETKTFTTDRLAEGTRGVTTAAGYPQKIGLDSKLTPVDRAVIAKHEATHSARNIVGRYMSSGELSPEAVKLMPESMTKYAGESYTIRSKYNALKAAGESIPTDLEKLNAELHLLEEKMAYSVAGQAEAINPALRQEGSITKYEQLIKQLEQVANANIGLEDATVGVGEGTNVLDDMLKVNYIDAQPQTQPTNYGKILGEGYAKPESFFKSKRFRYGAGISAGAAAVEGARRAMSSEEPQKKALGGVIYASTGKLIDFQPKGTDTVPAMLTPGEFVINAKSTAQHLPLLKAINKSKGGAVYLAEGSHEEVKPTWWSRTKDFGQASLDVGLGVLESTLGVGQLAVGTATGLTTMAAGKVMGDQQMADVGYEAMMDMNRSAFDHMEAGAARGVGKHIIDPTVEAATGALFGKSSDQEGYYSNQLEKSEAKLAAEPTWVGSDNPALAFYGGGGAGVNAQANAVNGAMQVGGAGVLSVGSAFADMENTFSYGVGLRDKNNYDQREAGIQAFNASMEANMEAGAQDIGTAFMIGSGFMSPQEFGDQSASAKLNAQELESLRQDPDFGELAASTTQFADATAYAASNAAFGMKIDPLAPFFKGLKAAENLPEAARQTRVGIGKFLDNKDLVFSASDARHAAKNLVEGAIPEATVLSGTQNTGWINDATKVAEGLPQSHVRPTGATGMRAYTEVPVPGNLSKAQALEEAKRLTVGGDTKRTTVTRSWSDWFSGKDWKASTPGHAGNAVYGTVNDLPGAEQAARYAADGLSAKDVLNKGTVMGFNVDAKDLARLPDPFVQNPALSKSFESLPGATPAGTRTSAEVFNESAQSLQQKLLSESPGMTTDAAAIQAQTLLDNATAGNPGYKFPMGKVDPNSVKGATGLAFPPTAVGDILPTAVTGGVNAKTLGELVKRNPLHFAHKTQHAVEAIDATHRAELYLHDLHGMGGDHGSHGGGAVDNSSGAGDRGGGAGGHGSPDENKLAHKAAGGLIYANNGAFIAKGKDRIPAMLSEGEFVVNANATKNNRSLLEGINSGISYASNGALIGTQNQNINTGLSPAQQHVMGAINTGYYSRGGIVGYMNNGGYVRASYLENGGMPQNAVNRPNDTAVQTGVLNNSVGQNMVMQKPAWVDEFISQSNKVFQNLSENLNTSATKLAETGTNMLNSSQNFSSAATKLSDISLPETISMNGNFDFSKDAVKNIIGRSVGESVAINANNTKSSISDNNQNMRSSLNRATDGGLDVSGLA